MGNEDLMADNATNLQEEFVDTVDASSEHDDLENDNASINPPEEADIDEDISKTKAFSTRLKEEKQNLEIENKRKLDNIAISRGFNNWTELEQYDKQEKIRNLGINDVNGLENIIKESVENNPVVKEAKEIIERQKTQEGNRILNEQVEEIKKIDSSIKSFEDLLKMDNFDNFDNLVRKNGYSLADAYKLVNFEKLTSKAAKVAQQKVYNNIDSKGHITTIVSNSAGKSVNIPSAILAQYIDEGLTEKEAIEHYSKCHKEE